MNSSGNLSFEALLQEAKAAEERLFGIIAERVEGRMSAFDRYPVGIVGKSFEPSLLVNQIGALPLQLSRVDRVYSGHSGATLYGVRGSV